MNPETKNPTPPPPPAPRAALERLRTITDPDAIYDERATVLGRYERAIAAADANGDAAARDLLQAKFNVYADASADLYARAKKPKEGPKRLFLRPRKKEETRGLYRAKTHLERIEKRGAVSEVAPCDR